MATKKTSRKKATPKAATGGTTKKTKKKTTRKKAGDRRAAPRKSGSGLYEPVRVEREIGGRTLVLETGRMAKQADGACVARYGDTVVLATAQSSKPRADISFFPLTVDYREKTASAGRIPGGFFKREGRPTNKEILTCRIIDRSIRPLFPEGYKNEVQVLSQVLATDQEQESDVVAAIASFAALALSSIPSGRTLGMCRIGRIDGELVLNPTWTQIRSEDNQLNLTVAGHTDAIAMVEAGADEVDEKTMLDALELAHDVCADIAELIAELVGRAGKPEQEFEPPEIDEKLAAAIERRFAKDLQDAPITGATKQERKASIDAVKAAVEEAFPVPDGATDEEVARHKRTLSATIEKQTKLGERESILDGTRSDGRPSDEVRDIVIEVGVLPRVHGSALFTRGETQALGIATLGGTEDQQVIDGLYPEPRRRFLLHYNFPPFSVGEVKRYGPVGRREVGHGALAERALEPVLPTHEDFPYTIRITSEILESNGSSSMATVCAGTLALMDAGVKIAKPVAGIAMGLVMEGKDYAILSDILGSEDHCGDMDFKVAGTQHGITALQMDIKCEGLSRGVLEEALEQAREGRLHILREMLEVLHEPRQELSPNAPRLESVHVPPDRIGMVIGPAGRNIRAMQEEYDVRINIEDSGLCTVTGADSQKVMACVAYLEAMTAEVEVGAVYEGTVTSVKEFGAFVEILPGQEGMCHVSELADDFVRSVTDVVRIGDKIKVKVIGIDDFGKVKVSRKAVLEEEAGGGRRERGGDEPRGRRDRDREEEPRGRGRRDRDSKEDEPGGRGRRRDRDDEDRGPGRRRERGEAEPRGRGRRGRDQEDESGGRGRQRDRDDEGRGRRRERDDEGRGRGRSRGRDDEEDRGRGRRREREAEEPRGRGRRGRDQEDEPGPGGRGRQRDRDEEGRGRRRERDDEGRGRSRSRSGDDDDDRGRRRRGRDDDERGRGRRRERDEEEPRGRGRRGHRAEEEPEPEEPAEVEPEVEPLDEEDEGGAVVGELEDASDFFDDDEEATVGAGDDDDEGSGSGRRRRRRRRR